MSSATRTQRVTTPTQDSQAGLPRDISTCSVLCRWEAAEAGPCLSTSNGRSCQKTLPFDLFQNVEWPLWLFRGRESCCRVWSGVSLTKRFVLRD